MFKFDVINEFMCIVRGSGKFFVKKGVMVVFKGNFNFEKLLLGLSNGGGLGRVLLGYV